MTIFYWINPNGGSFQTSGNWYNPEAEEGDPPEVPGFDDIAKFNLDNTYTVTFSGSPINTRLFVEDQVTFNLGGFAYSLTQASGAPAIVVGDTSTNALLTLPSRILSGTKAVIGGDGNSGVGTVIVDNATWNNSSSLYVGGFGNGTLNILNGGQVSSTDSNIGRESNSIGQVLVNGVGSTWTITYVDGESLEIGLGLGSQGSLIVENGGQVINNSKTRVGEGGTGTILVTGNGSLWRNTGRILLGAFSGTDIMNVEADGRVESQFGVISGDRDDSTSTGQATISGNGSTWANTEFLSIGESRQGSLLVENGGLVSNTFALIGLKSTGVGTVTVTDSGSHWNNSQYINLGLLGNGTLNILNGGLVSSAGSTLGVEAGSIGRVTVNGTDSIWNNFGALTVGLENGSTGTVTVDGNGSLLNLTGLFTIGDRGQGTVTVQNGGKINANELARLGDSGFGVGTVTVDGSGSKWTNASGELFIGNYGKGTLNISNQGLVDFQSDDGNARIGIVSGSGGFLNISSGGGLKLGGDAVIGAGGNGIVTVEGNESSLEIAKFLAVSESTGSGNLYILNGGQVSNTTYSSIGVNSGSSGTVIVDGTGST